MPARTLDEGARTRLRWFVIPVMFALGLPLASWSCTCPPPFEETLNVCGPVECPVGQVACCPQSAGNSRCPGEFACRAVTECFEYVNLPDVPVVTPHECEADADCPLPAEPRCAESKCMTGKCKLIIYAGDRMESQKPGDCKAFYCTVTGERREIDDPSDVPIDGNECTFDTCVSGARENRPFFDGLPCPESGAGVCLGGKCRECDDAYGFGCLNGFVCEENVCVPPTCKNKMTDAGEPSQDCGGPCIPCHPALACYTNDDCHSKHCSGGICQAPTPTDTFQNGGETGADCGCVSCLKPCQDGEGCNGSADCVSQVCYGGFCQTPTCTDATSNGDEIGVDCGGSCEPCPQP